MEQFVGMSKTGSIKEYGSRADGLSARLFALP